jgi:hypothetical protein
MDRVLHACRGDKAGGREGPRCRPLQARARPNFPCGGIGRPQPSEESRPANAQTHRPQSILIIGAGPIVIGQACEFDYSGTQACKALKEEGYRVILVNSNPATIMTDPEFADVTYIEPLTVDILEKIIAASGPRPCCRRSAGRPRSTSRWSCTSWASSSATGSR